MKVFGQEGGIAVHEITLTNDNGMEARILTWGATVRDLRVPTPAGPQPVIIGFDRLEHYLGKTSYAGSIAGRFGNRIRDGRFTLDGQDYQVSLNENDKHHLHGGEDGETFSYRHWTLEDHDATSVTLSLTSPGGDAGYPGTLQVNCTYSLLPENTLQVDLTATTDAPTLCNPVTHCYFNLDIPVGLSDAPVPSVLDNDFMANADFYTPVDADNLPTGEVLAVEGTAFDFRQARPIRNALNVGYDMNFALRGHSGAPGALAHAATQSGPNTGLEMKVFTTEPGLQFYDGGHFAGPGAANDGLMPGLFCGTCLEPQRFPDSPNLRHFPGAVLRPGETYRQLTEYCFAMRGDR